MRNPQFKGKQAFLDYYETFWKERKRTDELSHVLSKQNAPALLVLPKHLEACKQLFKTHHLDMTTLNWFAFAFEWPKNILFPSLLPGHDQNLYYLMNKSSFIPIVALQPKNEEMILDACAAPGGKTLAMCAHLSSCHLIHANDISKTRFFRLKKVLESFQVTEIHCSNTKAETLFKRFESMFDKILLDAPCSSEKHVYTSRSEKYVNEWSPSRIKTLQQRQISLASGLFEALKVGGRLVYSTCALNTQENEYIVSLLLKKKKDRIRLLPWTWNTPFESGIKGDYPKSFPLHHVNHILPSLTHDLDPLFVAVFERIR